MSAATRARASLSTFSGLGDLFRLYEPLLVDAEALVDDLGRLQLGRQLRQAQLVVLSHAVKAGKALGEARQLLPRSRQPREHLVVLLAGTPGVELSDGARANPAIAALRARPLRRRKRQSTRTRPRLRATRPRGSRAVALGHEQAGRCLGRGQVLRQAGGLGLQ